MDLQELDDETLGWLLESYGEQEKLKGVQDKLAQSRALRKGGMDFLTGAQGRQSRGTFVANNPLEFIGAGIQAYRGNKQAKGYEAEADSINAGLGQRAKEYGAAALGRRKPKMTTPGMVPQEDDELLMGRPSGG